MGLTDNGVAELAERLRKLLPLMNREGDFDFAAGAAAILSDGSRFLSPAAAAEYDRLRHVLDGSTLLSPAASKRQAAIEEAARAVVKFEGFNEPVAALRAALERPVR